MVIPDEAATRHRRLELRRALREHLLRESSNLLWSQVQLELRADPDLDETEAYARVAKSNRDLWVAAQRQSTVLVRGGKRGEKGGLSTAPPTDKFGRVHLSDLDVPATLNNSGGLRAEARRRGFTPIDEKVQNFLDADQIAQDAEGDPNMEQTMAALAWLHKRACGQRPPISGGRTRRRRPNDRLRRLRSPRASRRCARRSRHRPPRTDRRPSRQSQNARNRLSTRAFAKPPLGGAG